MLAGEVNLLAIAAIRSFVRAVAHVDCRVMEWVWRAEARHRFALVPGATALGLEPLAAGESHDRVGVAGAVVLDAVDAAAVAVIRLGADLPIAAPTARRPIGARLDVGADLPGAVVDLRAAGPRNRRGVGRRRSRNGASLALRPGNPWSPFGPLGPRGPRSPCGPCGPWAPAMPRGPCGPGWPF